MSTEEADALERMEVTAKAADEARRGLSPHAATERFIPVPAHDLIAPLGDARGLAGCRPGFGPDLLQVSGPLAPPDVFGPATRSAAPVRGLQPGLRHQDRRGKRHPASAPNNSRPSSVSSANCSRAPTTTKSHATSSKASSPSRTPTVWRWKSTCRNSRNCISSIGARARRPSRPASSSATPCARSRSRSNSISACS